MRRAATIALSILLLASVARAQDGEDEDTSPPTVRIDGATVHAAARLLAEAHRVGVWVAAPEGPELEVTIEEEDPERAFAALASAAGLASRRRRPRTGDQYWIAEEARLLRAESASVRGLSGGRRVDLDLEGARARNVIDLLASVSRLSIHGGPLGAITVRLREARSSRALETIGRLANARVARRGRELSMRLGSLPPWPRRPAAECDPPRGRAMELACTPLAQMRLVGLTPDRALISAPGEAAAILREGGYLGAEGWRVAAIGEDRVELTRGESERSALVLGGAS